MVVKSQDVLAVVETLDIVARWRGVRTPFIIAALSNWLFWAGTSSKVDPPVYMVQNVKTGRDVVRDFWLLDVVCNVVEEVCWYWQIIIFDHCHHYLHHVFPPCCPGSRYWWKTSWRTSQPPLQSVIGGGLKIENCLISLSHVSKQIWLVQLSSSTAVPPTLHYLSWLLVHHQSHHKRGPTRWEKKRKRRRKGMRIEDWQQQPTPPASSCPPNYCASLGQSTRPHPAERSSHTCDQKSKMITALTSFYFCCIGFSYEIAPVHISIETIIIRNQFIESLPLFPPL